ncbi:hypothetical protein TIFTF001_023092 [Ficus carica]|uniref:Uncharacterized protein n=1 Tax=Ficus carica TaxID=3494 RepID=A0AA88ADZ8_FICCA|nr:hypothetical protein TIFTF001_023092 [Ficus carica]
MGLESQWVLPSEPPSSGSSGFSSSQLGPTLWLAKESTTNTPTGCSGVRPPDVVHGTSGNTFPRCQLDASWTNRRRPQTPTLHVSTTITKEPHHLLI